MSNQTTNSSYIGHIEELRRTLIRCMISVIVCAIPVGIFWRRIFDFVAVYPLRFSDPMPIIIYTAPAEAVILSLKITITGGLLLASPFIFFQIWRFIAPALYKKEKAVILPIVFASTFCFLAGFAFCYFLLPFLFQFLTSFAPTNI